MKNLKRALSFALATVMLIGMMVVGASAAGFEDADKIVNTDAVNTMVALGIIKGKGDGTNFDPEGIVTRAEMAKMICVALNGGKDPNLTGGGLYPDTKGHWASGYIDYCTNLGIVAGDTAGNFNPDKTVTGTEAAKMILIALGYNAETEKFVNDANWSLNINIIASAKDLYEDLTILPAEGLTRDNAAQMVFNGMNAEMVKYVMAGIINGNSVSVADDITGKTILTDKFGLKTSDAMVVMGTETAALGNANYAEEGKSKVATTTTPPTTITIDFAIDPALLGEQVKVLYKDNGTATGTLDSKDKVYGVIDAGTTTVYEVSAMKKLETGDTSVKIDDDTILTGLAAANIYVNGTAAGAVTNVFTASAGTAPATSATLKIVAGDDDVVDYVIATQKSLVKVSAVTEKKIAFTAAIGGASTWELKNVKGAEGLAKDDFALAYTDSKTTKTLYLEPVTVQTVEVTGKSGSHLVSNGTTIKLDGFAVDNSGETNVTVSSMSFNTKYDLYMVGDTYVLALATEEETVKDYAVVTDAKFSTAGTFTDDTKVQLLFTDGTKGIYFLPDNEYKDAAGTTRKLTAQNGATYNADDLKGKLVSYSIDGNEVALQLEGTALTTSAAYTTDNNIVKTAGGNYYLNDDAVVFQMDSGDSNKWKVYTGADYESLTSGTSMTVIAKTSGLKNISVVVLAAAASAPTSTAADMLYGFVTAGAVVSKDGSTYYATYTLWNGSETVTVTHKLGSSTTADPVMGTAGNFVGYKLKTTGELDASTVIGGAYNNAAFVTGKVDVVDGKKVVVDGNIYTITDDTQIIYVDSDADAGSEIGSILVKDAIAPKNNVTFILDTDPKHNTEFIVIFVDVNNDITQ